VFLQCLHYVGFCLNIFSEFSGTSMLNCVNNHRWISVVLYKRLLMVISISNLKKWFHEDWEHLVYSLRFYEVFCENQCLRFHLACAVHSELNESNSTATIYYETGCPPLGTTMREIHTSAFPFIGCSLVLVALLIAFPNLALWLAIAISDHLGSWVNNLGRPKPLFIGILSRWRPYQITLLWITLSSFIFLMLQVLSE